MIKQKVIFHAILVFAIAVMLDNTVRPHHHHFEQVCFMSRHCDQENEQHHKEGCGDDAYDHSHEHPINDQCYLNSVFITPSFQKTPGMPFLKDLQKTLSFFIEIEEEVPERNIRYRTKYSFLTLLSAGGSLKMLVRALRAPPAFL